MICVESASSFEVRGGLNDDSFRVEVGKADGELKALDQGGKRILEGGGGLNLWRAPTDNDLGSGLNAVTNPKEDSIANMVRCLYACA